ncbi:MAG: pyridoxal 5'-phosphate synthase glutaminase subunit PdxT [Deinococcaceae bacterium]
MVKIGVLALQGAFREHRKMLERLNVHVQEVRLPEHLMGIDGLIIPGGESTTMGKLMVDFSLREPIRRLAEANKPIWGTCAGTILLANTIETQVDQSWVLSDQPHLDLIDITVRRNAFGRQIDSFEANLEVMGLDRSFPAVFIRAPIIARVGPGVQVLSTVHENVVLVRQGNILCSSFHPELGQDPRIHEMFLGWV